MVKEYIDDTIVAISTPIGEGGIGIVRLSGKNSLAIADKIFMSGNGDGRPSRFKTYTTHYGWIVEKSKIKNKKSPPKADPPTAEKIKDKETEVIDEVLLTVMRAPKSYTKEDIVEINCHSGIVPLRKILDLVISYGARLAQPGEFTRRAFLNGRIDLAQAEAVIDIIRAKTDMAVNIASHQLTGGLSEKIKATQDELLDVLAHIEADMDFPDEELPVYKNKMVLNKLKKISNELNILLDESAKGVILREGILCVICGRPNVGKSTLMNALLRQDRMIVTPIPGTTRDPVEEFINVNHIPLRLVDTAGIIEVDNIVDKAAVLRSRKYLEHADIVLFMLDNSSRLKTDDLKLFSLIKDKKFILVLNKMDLPNKLNNVMIKKHFKNALRIKISAMKNEGLKGLEGKIAGLIWGGKVDTGDGYLITNSRHKGCLIKAIKSLDDSLNNFNEKASPEFIAMNLFAAARFLGEIVGEVTSEDILDRIFGQFCVGK